MSLDEAIVGIRRTIDELRQQGQESFQLLSRYEQALFQIAIIPNYTTGGDWCEIEQARAIATQALSIEPLPERYVEASDAPMIPTVRSLPVDVVVDLLMGNRKVAADGSYCVIVGDETVSAASAGGLRTVVAQAVMMHMLSVPKITTLTGNETHDADQDSTDPPVT